MAANRPIVSILLTGGRKRFFFVAVFVLLLTGGNTALTLNGHDISPIPRKWRAGGGTANQAPSPSGSVARPGAYKRPGFELPLAGGIPLRIMGLGASTVFGQESADVLGWRRTLRQNLVALGNPVNMVGTQRHGEMLDNDVEAYPGARIDIIYEHAKQVMHVMKPNVVILYAGSNDNYQVYDLPHLYKRYHELVRLIIEASPRVTVVMGTLMPTNEHKKFGGQDRVGDCNRQLRRLYEIFKRNGWPVVYTDMADEWGIHLENLGPDDMHPTRAGYEIMSRKFLEALRDADASAFLQEPEPVDPAIPDDGELERADEGFLKTKDEQEEASKRVAEEEEAAIQGMMADIARDPWAPGKEIKPPPPEEHPPAQNPPEDHPPAEHPPEQHPPEDHPPPDHPPADHPPEDHAAEHAHDEPAAAHPAVDHVREEHRPEELSPEHPPAQHHPEDQHPRQQPPEKQ